MRTLRLTFLPLFITLTCVAVAQSENIWTGSTSSDFSTASNWSRGSVPTLPTPGVVRVNSNGTYSPTIYLSDVSATNLLMGAQTGSDGTLRVQNGRTFTTSASVSVGTAANANVGLIISGAGSNWTASSASSVNNFGLVGLGANSKGSLEILDGGTALVHGSLGVGINGKGALIVEGANSQLTTTSVMEIGGGNYASGTMTVQNGGKVASSFSDSLSIPAVRVGGFDASSIGSATITDSGSEWSSSTAIAIGLYGRGTLTIANGGKFTSSGVTVAVFSGPQTSTVALSGNSTWTNTGTLTIGGGGSGALTLSDASTVHSNDRITIAEGATSTGVVSLNGGSFEANAGLVFGNGTATFNLNGGLLLVGGADGIRTTGGSYSFNWAGGTILADDEALVTSVHASLTSGTTTRITTNGSDAAFSGVLSGGGALKKDGPGTLTLSGANTYGGGTVIESGTLVLAAIGVNSAVGTGSLMIAADATLAGTGTIAGSTTIAGTLNPGELTFNRDLTLTGTSLTQLEILNEFSFDQLTVAGTFTAGGTLEVSLLGDFDPVSGSTFRLFATTGPLTGSFSHLSLASLGAGLKWDTSQLYSAGTLTVTASAIPEPSTYGLIVSLLAAGLAIFRRKTFRRMT